MKQKEKEILQKKNHFYDTINASVYENLILQKEKLKCVYCIIFFYVIKMIY